VIGELEIADRFQMKSPIDFVKIRTQHFATPLQQFVNSLQQFRQLTRD
jgi:hypothetical protein